MSDRVVERLEQRRLDRVWLLVDLDVLDQRVMPAVDSPGSPGLDFAQLADLLSRLVDTGRVDGRRDDLRPRARSGRGVPARASSTAWRAASPEVRCDIVRVLTS